MNRIQQFQLKSNKYQKDIDYSIEHSCVYTKNNLPVGDYEDGYDTNFCVLDATAQEVIAQLSDKRLAVLSFSCKRNPAGQSKTSISGQEADLSKISFLPTVLNSSRMLVEYYVQNRETDSYGGDVVAYTPKIPFLFEGCDTVRYADVISCASPSIKHLSKVSPDRVRTLLERRIDIILSSALCHGVKNIVLGAWGCGGHGLSAESVAKAFKSVLDTGYHGVFENVIFAVPKTVEDDHFDTFDTYFGGELFAEG